MDHIEASAKIKKARTGTIPWKDRCVLIYAKGRHNKGDVARVYDVHMCQKTKSGLQITVESEVIGRRGQRQMYDYEDLVDEHWELPLHLVERPLNPAFHPKRNYIHSMTFHYDTPTSLTSSFVCSISLFNSGSGVDGIG
uniref:Uncharacterized protein n=1 Tax=Moniliophthora roreri TaxID=221103 RepID=A0A0W0FS02_MONRR